MSETLRVMVIAEQPADIRKLEALLVGAEETGRLPAVHFELEPVADCAAGIHYLRQASSDLLMVGLSTPDDLLCLAELRQLFPDLPIIVGVDPANESLALLAIAQGASDYWLHGQSSLREMASVFRNLLGQAHLAARCRRLNWLEGFIGEFIWRADPDLRLAEVSASVERLAGLTPEEALQCSLEDLLAPADRPTLQKALAEFSRLDPASEAGRALTLELEHLRRGKANFWAEISLHPVRDPQGKLTGFTGSTRDVSDRHAVQEQLNYISLHDALTGLFNRTYFEEELKRLEYSRLYPITFLTVDLEGLRNINYDQGMQAGDERLKQVANILKLTFRSEDMIARVGGDEFIVIMPRTHARAAAKALQRVANLLETYNQDAPEAAIRLTMGVATAEQGSSLMETLKAANVQKFPQKVTA